MSDSEGDIAETSESINNAAVATLKFTTVFIKCFEETEAHYLKMFVDEDVRDAVALGFFIGSRTTEALNGRRQLLTDEQRKRYWQSKSEVEIETIIETLNSIDWETMIWEEVSTQARRSRLVEKGLDIVSDKSPEILMYPEQKNSIVLDDMVREIVELANAWAALQQKWYERDSKGEEY